MNKPWNDPDQAIPQDILVPRGMIGPEERRCYFWLAKNALTDRGCIVDAGSFIGASTFCFAAGAAAAGRQSFGGEPIVHAFDYFQAIDDYVAEYIRKNVRPIEKGESYLDVFESQIAAHRALVKAYPGDFLAQRWGGLPIDVLFIDVAKTAALNAHAIAEFFPHLTPGRSMLVHQDYFHCWHPYIHIGMEYFSDEFELVDEHVPHQSRLWRLVRPLPAEKIGRMGAYALDAEERMALLDRLIAKSSDHSRPMMEVVRMWQRCIDKDFEGAARDMARLRKAYGVDGRPELWFRQALAIEQREVAHFARCSHAA